MNNFSGIGRIATDAKIGNGVLTSLLAVRRIYKSSDGVEADLIPLTLFGKQAENFNRLTSKGDKIGIDGSVKTGKYADENGEIHYGWSVTVNHFYLINYKAHGDKSKDSASRQAEVTVSDNELPF